MKQTLFPNLGESYYEERLPNGLLIRVVPKKDFAKKYAFLGVDFGSIDTSFTLKGKAMRVPDGIAHYLEHKMFDLPEDNAMNLFARYGGSPNAFTSYAMTAYYVACTQCFEENLRILLSMVATPYFTEDSVEKERGIIEQEIRMYEDSADSRVYEELFRTMFTNHPARVPIAGTVESIGEITAQMLYDCHEVFYQPSNMMLCVVGDVDAERICRIAREEMPEALMPLPERNYGEKEQMLCENHMVSRQMVVSMPTFTLGYKCEAAEPGMAAMRREIIGDLAAEVLVGESSSLYQRLYEEGLIDAGFSAGYESIKEACLLSAGGDSSDPEKIKAAIEAEAQRICREGVDTELFYRLKKSLLGRRTRDLDSFESICYRVCAYHFDGVDYFRFPEAYADVTPEDVQKFLAETVQPERSVLSVILPKEES